MSSLPTGAGPFSRAHAHSTGMTDSALRHRTRTELLERLRRGVYCETGTLTGPLRAVLAAATAYPGVPLSHLSVAVLQGIPIVAQPFELPEVTIAPKGSGKVRGAKVHRARTREHELMYSGEVLHLSPARTVIDIARRYRLVTAVVAIDYVLHEGLVDADELLDVLDFCRTWPGAERARRAVRASDSRSESPFESVSRLVIPSLGLPRPEPQVIIRDRCGQFLGRSDFYWDEAGVVGEADGRDKYKQPGTAAHEKKRALGYQDVDLEVAWWHWEHAWSGQAELKRRVERAIQRAAARDRLGTGRLWVPESTPRITVL